MGGGGGKRGGGGWGGRMDGSWRGMRGGVVLGRKGEGERRKKRRFRGGEGG